MPFVTDSRQAGYLGPDTTEQPLFGDAWEDWLHDLIAGISGMPGNLVFPRWQPAPPVRPTMEIDFAAFGITDTKGDWDPYVGHIDSDTNHPNGYDAFQQFERNTILVSFYGPNANRNAVYLRAGLHISQNQAAMRAASVGLIEVIDFTHVPELFKQKWVDRVDMSLVLTREVRFNYPVLNFLSVAGLITAQDPITVRTVTNDFNTGG